MKKMEVILDAADFPARLGWLFDGSRVYDSSCSAAAKVWYVDTGYYLKARESGALAEEARCTRLFHELGLGVEVMDYFTAGRDYLVTREAAGEDLTHFTDDPETICRVLAEALRRLHSVSIEGIPESSEMLRLRKAAQTMGENDYRLQCDTLIHGDACLPNVMMKDGKFSCFIDCGQAGTGDRHVDLYWAVWSLQYNLKTDRYTDLFLNLYGRDHVDMDLLRLIRILEN